MSLYILGNGFDLAHDGLDTRYSAFKQFCHKNNTELYKILNDVYNSKDLWCDFEKTLGEPNLEQVNYVNTSFKVNLFDGQFVNKIHAALVDWIGSIKLDNVKRKFNFDCKDKFFTFNYTCVLEQVYGIELDNVLHLHGNSVLTKFFECDKFIFGHNKNLPQNSPEILVKTKKNTEAVIKMHEKTMKAFLDQTQEVIVIGHSYSDIDWPYFFMISNYKPNVKWKLYYHSPNQLQQLRVFEAEMIKHNNGFKYQEIQS